jgi:sugar lactone lactonase YvrE
MRSEIVKSFVLIGLVVACAKDAGKSDSAGAGATAAAAAPLSLMGMKTSETGGFKVPESVKYDADLDVFFVSNINGNPSQKDGNGFISMVRADSTSVVNMFVEGGKNGVTLNAPKGMAIVGDTLWVADIDAVRGFNKRTGAKVADIPLTSQSATFLNDVAAGAGGALYITDTGIVFDPKGVMTHPGVDRVFKIDGRTITEAAKGDSLAGANGIVWDAAGNRWLLAPFNGKAIQAWTEGSAAPTTVVTGPGGYDGIEPIGDGVFAVSSWADSSVHVFRAGDATLTQLIANVTAPADFGFDTKRRVIALPRFNDGKVEFYMVH